MSKQIITDVTKKEKRNTANMVSHSLSATSISTDMTSARFSGTGIPRQSSRLSPKAKCYTK